MKEIILEEDKEIFIEDNNKAIIGNSKTGFIMSQSVEANILYMILKKLNMYEKQSK